MRWAAELSEMKSSASCVRHEREGRTVVSGLTWSSLKLEAEPHLLSSEETGVSTSMARSRSRVSLTADSSEGAMLLSLEVIAVKGCRTDCAPLGTTYVGDCWLLLKVPMKES